MLTVIQYYIIKKTKTSRKDLKKEGIMRINSYNKFFAKVAEIMNTSIKAVKPLEGRYKVELANHVYLKVYSGVDGSLFIHDHRGISHITSCYDFEDFKTMKDLYERLVSDYSESAKKDVMEVRQESNSRLGIEKTSLPCLTCKHFCVRFDNERIKMTHCVRKNTENYLKAAKNPNWHNVSLKTLANIDFDMLDEKRQVYFSLYRKWKETLKNLRKCSCGHSYEKCYANFRRLYITAFQNRKISSALVMYFDKKISMANVECGVWSSAVEVATGQKESRKFNRQTLRY